jgi:hypothetical protein
MNEKTGDQGRGTTDSQGRYRCGAMTGGGPYRAAVFPSSVLNVPYPTADGSPYPTIEVKDGKTEIDNIRISIDRPVLALTGQVIDDAGNAVSDAVIRALPSAGGGPPQFHSWLRLPMTSTDVDGKFRIADLAPGNYAVQARASDGAEGVVPPVAAGTNGITIRIERPGSIEGTLVGFSQPPVVYARTMGEWKLLPGSVDGATFRVTGVHAGKYLVNAQTTFEGDAHVVEVRAGQVTKVVMTSHGQGTIEGTVLDFRSKKPIANASCHTVMAVDGEQSITNWDLSSAPKSDASGRVLLDPAPAGNVNVNCQMAGLRWSNPSADVRLAAGGRATVQLFYVGRPRARLAGQRAARRGREAKQPGREGWYPRGRSRHRGQRHVGAGPQRDGRRMADRQRARRWRCSPRRPARHVCEDVHAESCHRQHVS